jgi:hypothetical protein
MGVPANDVQDLTLESGASMASDFQSFAQEVKFFDMGSVQMTWTGADSTTGTFVPQASVDGINWCDLASGTTLKKTSVGAGCCMYIFSSIEYPWFRVSFTKNSNTSGTVVIRTFMKRRRHV